MAAGRRLLMLVYCIVSVTCFYSNSASVADDAQPAIGACFCSSATSPLIIKAVKRVCEDNEESTTWTPSSDHCYVFTGSRAICSDVNGVNPRTEYLQVRRLDDSDVMWVNAAHLTLSSNGCSSSPASHDVGCPQIVTRAEWRARKPRNVTYIRHPTPKIFIHHTDTGSCTDFASCTQSVRSIQDFHMDVRKWDDIGYNFLVGEDGRVYEGRGWDRVGAQVKYFNDVSLGFAMIGTYTERLPANSALSAVTQLIACALQTRKSASDYTLHGHRDAGCTDCPGDKLYALVTTWPHYGGTVPHNCSTPAFKRRPQHSYQPSVGWIRL